jgi:PRTRC genetic system ThiF family protein
MKIDLSFAQAALVLPKEYKKLNIFLIGAGGTGSFAAMNIARLAFELKITGKVVAITIIDPDIVERNNIPRSNFCMAEIGRFKAQTLAERISLAWGMEIGYANEEFNYEKHVKEISNSYRELTILVGCVDNHLARREIQRSLIENSRYDNDLTPKLWWIDGGNGKSSGQVLFGSEVGSEESRNYFSTAKICRKLPSPAMIHPELLENQELLQKRQTTDLLSCPERIRLGEQSLNINQRVAVEIAEMLTEFLLTNGLRRFASYFDLESGTSSSLYCTAESIQKAIDQARLG